MSGKVTPLQRFACSRALATQRNSAQLSGTQREPARLGSRQPAFLCMLLWMGLDLLYLSIDFSLVALIQRLVDLKVYWLRSLVEQNGFFEHLLDRFFERTRAYSNSL